VSDHPPEQHRTGPLFARPSAPAAVRPPLTTAPAGRIGPWVDRLRNGRGGLVGLALLVGLGSGLGAVAFRELIAGFTEILSGRGDYSDAGRVANHWVPWLGPYFLIGAPVVAGLIYGPLIYTFAREARGHGVPEVMLAVAQRNGRIPAKVAVVKSLASALCIGAGGSVGREGPIVQIGSALGSSLGRALRIPDSRLRLLVACGAAGGIAATFNAPIAGVFFSLELILGDFATENFAVVVLSAVLADVVSRAFLGNAVFLTLPAFHLEHLSEYGLYAVLGLLAALVGLGFTKVLYGMEDLADWLWRGPEWLRPAVGGVLLGGLLLALPQMYGVGYPILGNAVRDRYTIAFLLVLLVGKILACSLTISIGGSGGVFAPSLFMGAALGDAFGQTMHAIAPGIVAQPGAYALVGMGAVFAGAARAPITSVLILFELTGEYTIILPLMLAVVVATAVSRYLSPQTIYTLKLARRGITLGKAAVGLGSGRTVADAMGAVPEPLAADAPLSALLQHFDTEQSLPVVDGQGHYRGLVLASAVEAQAVAEDEASRDITALDLTVLPTAVRPDEPLDRVVELLAGPDGAGGVPVVDADGVLTGWVNHRQVIGALGRRTASSTAPAQA